MKALLFIEKKDGSPIGASLELFSAAAAVGAEATAVSVALREDALDEDVVADALSEKGKEINQWLDGFLSGLFQKLLSEVPEEKRKIFVEVLDVMYQGMCHIQ